jgi:UDP-N-acetylmuramoyl-tripeptide--D-alanyl-D-alanine ligase
MLEKLYEIFCQFPIISTDTRKIEKNSIFFALKGGNFDGNAFAEQALSLGAKYVVIDKAEYKKNDSYILVDDVLLTLQNLANYHRKKLDIPIIAITGSNGKTTTKELVSQVLMQKYKVYYTQGNLNNHIGVPLTLLSITEQIEIAVVEMGANHQKEIELLCKIAEPSYGLITNIGKAHLEGFGGVEGIIKGKGELLDFLKINQGTAFINQDSDTLLKMSKEIDVKYFYGTSAKKNNGKIISSENMLTFTYQADHDSAISINSNLIGDYNLANLLAACTIGNYFKVPLEDIKFAIENYYPNNNRSQILKLADKTLILDAYNANPSSVEAAILNFSSMRLDNKVIILGDMLELGEDTLKEHQLIVNLLEAKKFEKVFLVGKNFMQTQSTYPGFENAQLLIKELEKQILSNSSILIKGSRGIKLETVSEFLQTKKGV